MQLGFYIDQTRCTGCRTCVVACKDWHDSPAGPTSWIRVKTIEKGKYPNIFVAYLPTTCFHCQKPACIEACPANAIRKQPYTGIVIVNQKDCLGAGCRLCKDTCPYDAPQFRSDRDSKMEKCDLCAERWVEGKKPICVDGCPMRALDAGPIEQLKEKYSNARKAEGFIYSTETAPSVIFKPKTGSKRLTVQRVRISPAPAKTK